MLRRLLRPLWAPRAGFLELEAEAPGLGRSLGWMMVVAWPWWILSAWFGTRQALLDYEAFRQVRGGVWDAVLRLSPDLSRADVRQAFAAWPVAPPWQHVVPWIPLLAALGLFGAWLHDGAWDHAGLWMLRGLKPDKKTRVKATLVAEAQAQAVGWIGTALGLLVFVPGIGGWVGYTLFPLTAWLWLLRGWALAAHHGCPVWKGVGATLLHLVLFGLFLLIFLMLPLLLLAPLLAGG